MNENLLWLLIPLYLGIIIFYIVALWKIYEKAGRPGWNSIVPFYNFFVLLEIVGRSGWWLILMFIPLVNIIIGILVTADLAKAFGKGGGFAAGLIFLPFIFYPILGFGPAVYSR